MQVNFKIESKRVTDALTDVALRQMPFALAKTMTAVAGDVRDHLKKQLPVAFDRPTAFTQRGVFMQGADKKTLTSTVFFPDSQPEGGRAAREYLQPGVSASTYARMQKKTEYLLTRMGHLPAGWVTVPGRYIQQGKLDGYGNMPGSYYKQIIRNLGIKITKGPPKPISAASQKRAVRMSVGNEFFAVSPGANRLAGGGGWLPPGVYKREGRKGEILRQYLKFVKKASYRQRLDVKGEAQKAVSLNVDKRFKESVQDILTRFKAR